MSSDDERPSTAPDAKPKARAEPKARGIRQTMSDLHIWAGLLTGWFLSAMFLTGTVSYFKDELSQWMRPELPHQASVPDPALVARRVVHELQATAPNSTQWSVGMPDARNNVANAFWRVPGVEGRRAFQSASAARSSARRSEKWW